jgi:LacI family transcriptional regulator
MTEQLRRDDVAARKGRSKRVTINDVALEAGVSRQTVSRAMNGMSEISPETRDRVLAASETLGYLPSRFAANLARQKSHSIGLVITSLRNPYYTDLAAALLEEFAKHDWQVVVSVGWGESDEDIVARLSTQVDAIVGYVNDTNQNDLRRAARGIPIVLFETTAVVPGTHSVAFDFEAGMRALIDGLRERGATRFGMIEHADPRGRYYPSMRRQWFEECVGPEGAARVVGGDETLSGGAEAFDELITSHPDIDTIIAFNDIMAIGAIQRAQRLGLEVPGDIRIAGVDGLGLGADMTPSLTSLSIDRPLVARSTATLLESLLADPDGSRDPSTTVILPTTEWRESA